MSHTHSAKKQYNTQKCNGCHTLTFNCLQSTYDREYSIKFQQYRSQQVILPINTSRTKLGLRVLKLYKQPCQSNLTTSLTLEAYKMMLMVNDLLQHITVLITKLSGILVRTFIHS